MTKQPAPSPILVSSLIVITGTFSVLEFSGNVFGLDYGAFYLHYTGIRSPWIALAQRVGMTISIQALMAVLMSALFFFNTDAKSFRLHLLLEWILLLQNFCTGCLFSAFFPVAIPKDITNKIFRTNPGLGFSLNAGFTFITIILFYALLKILPEATAVKIDSLYAVLLPAMFIPAAIVLSAKELGRKKYKKWWSLTIYD